MATNGKNGHSNGKNGHSLPTPKTAALVIAKIEEDPPEIDPGEPLQDVRSEQIAVLVAQNYSWTDAYQCTYGCERLSARANIHQLIARNSGIRPRVAYLRKLLTADKVEDGLMIRQHFRDVVTAIPGRVDEHDAVVQSFKRRRRVDDDGVEWEYQEVTLCDKNGAAYKLAEIQDLLPNPKLKLEVTVQQRSPQEELESLVQACAENPLLRDSVIRTLETIKEMSAQERVKVIENGTQ